ncbi:OB-fold domain-containing protein [Pigmentiphaga soli]|uniref:OB-fold domain-containing protein n=1 Tax=Pigmentiphaga soli TaxID=1007095 RepID=A0ABP8H022_9BURK
MNAPAASHPPSPHAVYLGHLKEGRLAYQFSLAAGRPVFFPRVACPYTGSTALEWRISKGLGTVYSSSVLYPRDGEPYNVALVDCDEGFRLMTRIERIPPQDVAIGMRVRFAVCAADAEEPCPVFIPMDAS